MQTDAKYGRVVTRLKKRLTHPTRIQETALGGLLSDIMCECLGLDIMLLGSGSVRSDELGPIVLYSDLCECFPYDDAAYMIKVTGEQFKRMIKFMVRDEVWDGAHCEFYQLSSGMRVIYDRASHEFQKFDFKGKPIEDDKIYRIGLQQFHFNNLEDFFNILSNSYDESVKAPVIFVVSLLRLSDHSLVPSEIDSAERTTLLFPLEASLTNFVMLASAVFLVDALPRVTIIASLILDNAKIEIASTLKSTILT
jgi:2',3'-cyclic-nucleotide 2'-phosphodiesterase (5'-nucleotidase family)